MSHSYISNKSINYRFCFKTGTFQLLFADLPPKIQKLIYKLKTNFKINWNPPINISIFSNYSGVPVVMLFHSRNVIFTHVFFTSKRIEIAYLSENFLKLESQKTQSSWANRKISFSHNDVPAPSCRNFIRFWTNIF